MIITRKIQIHVIADNKEQKDDMYARLRHWMYLSRKLANIISTHKFIQDNIKDFIYLTEEVKVKLADVLVDEQGMLNTSEMNSTYRIASMIAKGELPMSIASAVNSVICKTYKKERKEYFLGEKSLRSYKQNMPMPLPKKVIYNFKKYDDKNYQFSVLNTPGRLISFKTFFGKDRSNNKIIVERIINGTYKMCDSAIKYDQKKKKYFLLLTFDMPQFKVDLKEDKSLQASLDIQYPIIVHIANKKFEIGNRDEYLYRRKRIQQKLQSLQKDLKYSESGKGRKHKLQAIERFHKKEKNYIQTKLHKYSFELIKIAINHKVSTIELIDLDAKIKQAKEQKEAGDDFLLRNWNYYGLQNLITYKAEKFGIKVNVL